MKNVLPIVWIMIGFLTICLCLYGSYWVAKNISYWIFYEDMVKETIRELVDKKYLIGV